MRLDNQHEIPKKHFDGPLIKCGSPLAKHNVKREVHERDAFSKRSAGAEAAIGQGKFTFRNTKLTRRS